MPFNSPTKCMTILFLLTRIWYCHYFYFCHSDRYIRLSRWGFNFHFFNAYWCPFVCLFAICVYSFMNCFFTSFVYFLIELFVFLAVEFWEFFIYSRYLFFFRYVICRYFLPFCSISFYSLNRVFHKAEVLHFLVYLQKVLYLHLTSWSIPVDFCKRCED